MINVIPPILSYPFIITPRLSDRNINGFSNPNSGNEPRSNPDRTKGSRDRILIMMFRCGGGGGSLNKMSDGQNGRSKRSGPSKKPNPQSYIPTQKDVDKFFGQSSRRRPPKVILNKFYGFFLSLTFSVKQLINQGHPNQPDAPQLEIHPSRKSPEFVPFQS